MVKKIFILVVCFLIFGTCPVIYAGNKDTSGITAYDIFSRVSRDINDADSSGEPKFSFCTQPDFIQWTDEAVREIVYQTRCLESGVSVIAINVNQRSYDITGSFLNVEKAEYDTGVTKRQVQIYDIDRVPFSNLRYGSDKESGNPKNFSVWNNKLFIEPIPRIDQSGDTIYIYSVTLPSGVTQSSSPIETPSYFDLAIINYVKAKALFKKQFESSGNYFMARFDKKIAEYIAKIMRRYEKPIKE